jgi:hypothetical protein
MKTWEYGGIAPLICLLSSRCEQWAALPRPLCPQGKGISYATNIRYLGPEPVRNRTSNYSLFHVGSLDTEKVTEKDESE